MPEPEAAQPGTQSALMSLFTSARSTMPERSLTIADLVALIRDPAPRTVSAIARALEALAAGDTERFAALKRELPAVSIAGTFSLRNNLGLLDHSGLMPVDLDPACKDIARLAFLSHDPECHHNPHAEPLIVANWAEPEPTSPSSTLDPPSSLVAQDPNTSSIPPQKDGLEPPEKVRAAVEQYRTEEDTLGEFLTECTRKDPEETTPHAEIYTRYIDWARDAGIHRTVTKKTLAKMLREKGWTERHTNQSAVNWVEIALAE